MNKLFSEIIKFVYSVILAIVSLFVLAVVLDLLCALVSGGWTDYTGYARAGTWPIVSGTFGRALLTPFVYILFLLLGIGGIVRMVMGISTPFFLRRWETGSGAKEEQ